MESLNGIGLWGIWSQTEFSGYRAIWANLSDATLRHIRSIQYCRRLEQKLGKKFYLLSEYRLGFYVRTPDSTRNRQPHSLYKSRKNDSVWSQRNSNLQNAVYADRRKSKVDQTQSSTTILPFHYFTTASISLPIETLPCSEAISGRQSCELREISTRLFICIAILLSKLKNPLVFFMQFDNYFITFVSVCLYKKL